MCQNILTLIKFILAYEVCVHKCIDELHKISCNSYYTYIDNTAATGGSKYFELGRQPHVFLNLKYLLNHLSTPHTGIQHLHDIIRIHAHTYCNSIITKSSVN